MDPFRVDGRVALVTGAAQGIGAAIARRLAAAGAALALVDRNGPPLDALAAALRTDHGGAVVTAVADVREHGAVDAFVARAVAELGRLDIVVNNAGGGFLADFVATSERGEAALIAENFTSATHVIRACIPHLVQQGGGSIVNVTSIEAHRAAPGYATYAAMKAALANLSMSLALELASDRIRVNCVAPDMIPTPGIEPDPVGSPLPIAAPLPDPGSSDDVANAVVFLAGDGSRFVTGTTIHVDGGNTAAGGWKRQSDGRFAI